MLAAFLTLRVVDQFASGAAPSEALSYQIGATREYLERLDPELPEVGYLLNIVRAASEAVQSNNVMPSLQPLLAFADWLERELHLAQALDALNTSVRAFEGRGGSPNLFLQLRRGRVLRRMGLFAEASEAYSVAEHLALALGDSHHGLLAGIGQAIVLQRRGNLPAARKMLESVRIKAQETKDRDAEARASHDLAVNSIFQQRYDDAAMMAFRAFELYDDIDSRRMALSDLGLAFKHLGHYEAARDAFELVVGGEHRLGPRVNALLELLDVASLKADRIGFERYRRDLEGVRAELPATTLVDFDLKLGGGFLRFGQSDRAIPRLKSAIEIAERHNLNRQLFEAEAALESIVEAPKSVAAPAPLEADTGTAAWDDTVLQVAHTIHELRGEPELVSTYSSPARPWEHNHHADR
jgi:tetratricopeptide (TPR) repeat protein